MVVASLATAQTTSFVQLLHDTSNNTYRFQRTEVRKFEALTDSIVVDRFPEKWLDDGAIVYVTNTNATFTTVGFWGLENGAWVKL